MRDIICKKFVSVIPAAQILDGIFPISKKRTAQFSTGFFLSQDSHPVLNAEKYSRLNQGRFPVEFFLLFK
jgi:hypothetical protein